MAAEALSHSESLNILSHRNERIKWFDEGFFCPLGQGELVFLSLKRAGHALALLKPH